MATFSEKYLDDITGRIKLFKFLKSKTGFKPDSFIITGAISGLANILILVSVSSAIYNLYKGASNAKLFLLFILLLVLSVCTQRKLYYHWIQKLESSVDKARSELCAKLVSADTFTLEKYNKGEIYNRITQELNNISQFGVYIIKGVQAIFTVIFASIYIAKIFFPAIFLIGGLIAAGASIYLLIVNKIYARYAELNKWEVKYFNWLNDILYGRKEIKFNNRIRENLLKDAGYISDEMKKCKKDIGSSYNKSIVLTNGFFYLLFGAVVFLMPILFNIKIETLVILSTVTIYMSEPVSNIVSVLPLFQKASLSAEFITGLETTLDSAAEPTGNNSSKLNVLNKIEVKDLKFRYTVNDSEFMLGPLNLEINKGEIVFLTGGNGSGKTTLMKLLASFYMPEEGVILINGLALSDSVQTYRELTSGIFSDFHLFEKVYGMSEGSDERINYNLKLLNIHNKVKLNGNVFSTLNLSTGQKKRLAMAAALAEDKQLYFFDEWAAEQDPEYHEYFYCNLLPELKKNGKTIIAVSHDERYFTSADKIVKMEYGKIIPA